MIARRWRGWAEGQANADAYAAHFESAVLDGELLIDLEEDRSTVTLHPQQAFTVPRGAVHRTRAPRRTTILMVEAAGVEPTGD